MTLQTVSGKPNEATGYANIKSHGRLAKAATPHMLGPTRTGELAGVGVVLNE